MGSVVWALPEALKKNTFLYLKSLCVYYFSLIVKSNLQLYWFCFILLCNWSRKLACPLNQSDAKLKQILIFFASVIVSFFFSAEFLLAHCDIFLFPKYRIYSLMCPEGLSNVLNLEICGFLRRCTYSIFTIFIKCLVYLATKQQIIAISENVMYHWHRFRYFQASKEILVIINNSLVHFFLEGWCLFKAGCSLTFPIYSLVSAYLR